MRSNLFLRTVAAFSILVGAEWSPAIADPPHVPPDPATIAAFQDFGKGVQQYIKVRKAMPEVHTTRHRKEIVDRRQALAQAIREARADAKQGDIFTPEISKHFILVIRSTLQGSKGANVRRTLRSEEPVANLLLTVNSAYPEDLPLATIPPTLLRRLPQLPERLAYRIVGHDLVLQDTEARLVIDLIPGALP